MPISRSPFRLEGAVGEGSACGKRARHLKPVAPIRNRARAAAGRAINTASPRRASTAPTQSFHTHTRTHARTRKQACTRNTCAKMLPDGTHTKSRAHTQMRARTHTAATHTRTHADTHSQRTLLSKYPWRTPRLPVSTQKYPMAAHVYPSGAPMVSLDYPSSAPQPPLVPP